MPIRHGGKLASRASTWPRDHFWRSTRAPRRSWPTMWNEFLPISMPITATLLSSFWDMACSFVFGAPLPVWLSDRAGARPDHPILRLPARRRPVHETRQRPASKGALDFLLRPATMTSRQYSGTKLLEDGENLAQRRQYD